MILLVEDDDDVRVALHGLLADEGYEITSVSNGQAGLDVIRGGSRPDLVLLDWNMVPMNGAKFIESLSAAERPPIALLTADTRVAEKAKAYGCVAFLKKPVDLDALFELVERSVAPSTTLGR
ncbi:MAG: response regulator [Archangium sp.]|nr:response regulator [Archangium sp.]